MQKEVKCLPKWWLECFTRFAYNAVQVPKNSPEIKEIFTSECLSSIPEDYVWKILTPRESVYRAEDEFKDQFNILENKS